MSFGMRHESVYFSFMVITHKVFINRSINRCMLVKSLSCTQGVRISQLALCIPRSSADIFKHIILDKYLGVTW